MRARGWGINRKRVARLMRVNNIVGWHLRVRGYHLHSRRILLALPRHGDRHLLEAGRGRVVGWSIANRMRTRLVTDAVELGVAARGGQVHGVVAHTDRGAQYLSAALAEVCRRHGIRRSMGRVGSSCDCEDDQVPLRAVP